MSPILQIASKNIEGKQGNVYNIASGKRITISGLAKLMEKFWKEFEKN